VEAVGKFYWLEAEGDVRKLRAISYCSLLFSYMISGVCFVNAVLHFLLTN